MRTARGHAAANITVAIESSLLKQARAIAARRGSSVSALLADELRELIGEDRAYEAARHSAREVVRTYTPWVHSPTTPETILRASEIAELSQLSFWDALIVASAEQVGASHLYTADLNPGQSIVGVKIVNPLVR